MNWKKSSLKSMLVLPMLVLSLNSFAATVEILASLPTSRNDAVNLDGLGNIYVSHAGNFVGGNLSGSEVYKIDPVNTVSVAHEGLSGPIGNAFDAVGNFYVSNFNNGNISRFSSDSEEYEFVKLESSGGIVIDSENHIYASSYSGNTIYRIATDGVVEVWASGGGLNGPVGLVLDDDENLYVANYNDGKIFKVEGQSQLTLVATIAQGSQAYIGYITMANNVLYATGFDANKIFKVTLSGTVSVLSGTESTTFNNPNGIAASVDGQFLFVSEYGSDKLYQIDLNGSDDVPDDIPDDSPKGGSGGGAFGWLLLLALFPLTRAAQKRH